MLLHTTNELVFGHSTNQIDIDKVMPELSMILHLHVWRVLGKYALGWAISYVANISVVNSYLCVEFWPCTWLLESVGVFHRPGDCQALKSKWVAGTKLQNRLNSSIQYMINLTAASHSWAPALQTTLPTRAPPSCQAHPPPVVGVATRILIITGSSASRSLIEGLQPSLQFHQSDGPVILPSTYTGYKCNSSMVDNRGDPNLRARHGLHEFQVID